MQSVAELNSLSEFAIYVGKHDTWISERSSTDLYLMTDWYI